MRPTISIIVELPQMHDLVDRSGIGLEVSDQLLVMTALLERRKANLLLELHRFGHCAFHRAGGGIVASKPCADDLRGCALD
jgi:hypothetical protein